MRSTIKLKFDHNQEHQITAINSIVQLFDKLPKGQSEFILGDDMVPNILPEEVLDEDLLLANLNAVQNKNNLPINTRLDVDEGFVVEGVGHEAWRYPLFTIEMETGTGKTYVYLRTIYELKKQYGFKKFIVVVPSIAIYEGVLKAIEMTREHFRSLYSNDHLNVIDYDSAQISKLREFANSQFIQVMVITIDAFKKRSNNIYKRTEKLPGEKLPIQYIQETRPIIILDESQNYTSEKSREALRTLHPLIAIKYSATAGEIVEDNGREKVKYDNLCYRLNPVQAFRLNLVKKIQVFGVTEQSNVDRQFSIYLKRIKTNLTADVVLLANIRGEYVEREFNLKKGSDLETKTRNEHYKGFIIEEINRKDGFVSFTNGRSIALSGEQALTHSKKEIFRIQIEETIKQHFERQKELIDQGIKVLSLFFIDRVANYTSDEGLIKNMFDEAFEKLKGEYKQFKNRKAEEVREAYFAKKKTREGEIAIDTDSKNEAEREAEKEVFELIMRKKEQLLSLDEKVCFIFAHSALKEGWDNPNVCQICTLRNTKSEMRKRQEIGRGMRLCVNQDGNRVSDESINILTVIANESYESFVNSLQTEYTESGDVAPPQPSNVRRSEASRNDKLYKGKEFNEFWDKLIKKTNYDIKIDSDKLAQEIAHKMSKHLVPPPQILVKKGKYVITTIDIALQSIIGKKARIKIDITDTSGLSSNQVRDYEVKDNIGKILNIGILKEYIITGIVAEKEDKRVEFSNGQSISKGKHISIESEQGQKIDSRTVMETKASYPVFNLIERASKETTLTRATILKIFKLLPEQRKLDIFRNPEGFSAAFIFVIMEVLADHVADKIVYEVEPGSEDYDKDDLFPPIARHAQKELINGSSKAVYNLIQIDSDVEKRFVENRLNIDEKVILYFKFPNRFKVKIPAIIGNYVPDWGVVRYAEDGSYKLELVRETKSVINENLLQFTNEKRKIWCAEKHFNQLGIDYRKINPEIANWWEPEQITAKLPSFAEQVLNFIQDYSSRMFKDALPVYSLQAACGKYGDGQEVEELGWVEVKGRKLDKNMFIAKAVGHSMEPKIPDGAYCIFRANPTGSRNGKIVLVQLRDISDLETGGQYTIKKYNSDKILKKDGTWKHTKITLSPLNPEYDPMVYEGKGEAFENQLKVIAEFVGLYKS